MSVESGWDEAKHGEFSFTRILKRYLTEDDLNDMDEDLGKKIAEGGRGTVVIPTAESVQRVRDPLSDEVEKNFVDLALVALDRADKYMSAEDRAADRI